MSRSKKILKVTGYLAAGFVALAAVGAVSVYGVSNYKMTRQHVVQVTPVPVGHDAATIERGRHIVATRACADCHAPDFGGQKVIDDAAAGIFHGANLTHGRGGLPADYSDLDYVRAIRHGIARDGHALALMPSAEYAQLSDEDLGAVIAFLKSLPPVDRDRVPIQPGPLIRVLVTLGQVKLAADQIDHTPRAIPSVAPEISARYGQYLASSCTGCHGESLSGGKIPGAPPDWPSAANLTPHPTSHLSQWSEDQFIQTLRTRRRPDGTELSSVMPNAFQSMTDLELKALWTYIHALPPKQQGDR